MAFCIKNMMPIVTCSSVDSGHMLRAAEIADKSAGYTAPHPNAGCVIARGSKIVAEGFLYGQGTRAAEIKALEQARELAKGSTAYVNLEPGDCHGDDTSVNALIQAGVSKVVVGLRHPLKHFRGKAIKALRDARIEVDVLGEDLQNKNIQEALRACQLVNAPLLYREACRMPFSVLKYAMTLDGKIAASTGHAAWVSSKMSRKRVFEARSRSDAVIVGGNTVRRDNPRLTTRQEGGHLPARIVMSRSLKLPEEANLWDVSANHTIVATQHGANRSFQQRLARKGVEVVEFDMLTPKAVMEYCYDRGFLCVLWECGGALSAPAIESAVIHKIGPDMLISGYLHPIPDLLPIIPAKEATTPEMMLSASDEPNIISFYKAWDAYGAFSNFSAHPIRIIGKSGDYFTWKSVEHYYQAQKFEGVQDFMAQECIERIKSAESPEEAARIGRILERQRPELVRDKWESVKIDVMYRALKCKFSMYPHLSSLLVSTAGSILVEASPHDLFWGGGQEGEGLNHLGRLLMRIRAELLEDDSGSSRINLSTWSSTV
ncbi:riboflavin biosynthesis protein PYRR, chloroplastic isoform X2 [Cryptomeria japonica]|uniref:riboflavin biosynthesis protein PYRR, chloroplastic isoform X2 n=1 Tax=Cryptomeria japonica TaxID=3369 RepID=UPI0027D9D1A6|nr:riboflavin biosynthesis protein PYRR, chloroplastic isoform X2 [Cryptomeria japonica]